MIYEQGLLGKTPIGMTNGNITIKECPNNKADEVIRKYHYSHKTTKNRFKSFKVCHYLCG